MTDGTLIGIAIAVSMRSTTRRLSPTRVASAVPVRSTGRLHHRHPVDRGEPRPHQGQHRRPARFLGSIYGRYRTLVRLRYSEPVVVDGDFTMLVPDHPRVYALRRTLGDRSLEVWANLSGEPVDVESPQGIDEVLNDNPGRDRPQELSPWQARVYLWSSSDSASSS